MVKNYSDWSNCVCLYLPWKHMSKVILCLFSPMQKTHMRFI